jgi:homocysteine S-methyltransferase
MGIQDVIKESNLIMTEGAVVERLRREFMVDLNPHIVHAGLIYSEAKFILERIYKQYIDIVHEHDLPMIVLTPTRRANPERLMQTQYKDKDVNGDCVYFLKDIRNQYGVYSSKIFIGGLMGCKGDAYKPQEALISDEAFSFHQTQAQSLANAGVDFLCGTTLPAYSESLGLAMAMATTGKPYVLSFVVRPDGTLLENTPLHDAISQIDLLVNPKPLFYLVNCVHPSVLRSAFMNESNSSDLVKKRLIGIQANTSSKSPEELDGSAELISEDINALTNVMVQLHQEYGLKIFGGCCGTNDKHIQQLIDDLRIATP